LTTLALPHVHPRTPSRRDLLALLLVLVVAALVRMADGGRLSEYAYDQATLSSLALELATGRDLPLLGIQSSAGVPNSPMTVYVLAIPYLFTHDPQAIVLWIAAFNVIGVGLLWGLAYRYFNPTVALVAGLAYALHPHAIHYSRSIWAQDTHTPILLAALLLALYGYLERKPWAQALCLPLLLIGVQIHYAAWALLPAFAWVIWVGRRNIDWRALALGLLLALLTLAPFAIGISQAANAGTAASAVVDDLDNLTLRNKALLYMARLFTGLGGPWVGMDLVGVYDVVIETPTPVSALWLLVGTASVLGLLVVWRRWGAIWGALLFLWAVFSFLVFIPNWTGVYPHYFVPMLPGLALAAGLGVEWLATRAPRVALLRPAVIGLFALVLVTQGVTYWEFVQAADASATRTEDTPVHYLMDVRAALTTYPDIIISGGTTGSSGQPVWEPLLRDTASCVRELVIAAGGVALFPAGPFAVITPPGALEPATGDLYQTEAPVFVPLRPDEGTYRIDAFQAAPAWNGPELHPQQLARFANGVELTGYTVEGDRVYLRWLLPTAGSDSYQYFVHFLDASGEKIGQQDASFYPAHFWCAGDTIVTWIDADVPDATAGLNVGMYRFDGDQPVNSDIVDDAGNPVLPWVNIQLRD
jgi:4-amino-4-deoxy-L-arabinose transferase-like glycosyltransferase